MGVEVVWFIFIMFSLPIVYADYQVYALIAFKQMISDDPGNALQTWDPSSTSPCTWLHITCDAANINVTIIDLGDFGISGELAPELGQLKNLQYLALYNNKLTGEIPKEIGDLSNLISLDLYNNSLSGPIPETLGSLEKLKFFRIHINKLTGPIPLAMASLKNLVEVSLGGNYLCGPFTARCIAPDDATKCTDNYSCPCRCGPTFSKPCDYSKIPRCNTTLCCWN